MLSAMQGRTDARDPSHPHIGVGGIAIRDGSILLVMRGRAPYKAHWSIPGGVLMKGETLREAVCRELLEETGLRVAVKGLAGILEAIGSEDGVHYVIIDYFVDVIGGELAPADDALEAAWIKLDEVARLKVTPQLISSLTEFGVLGQPE